MSLICVCGGKLGATGQGDCIIQFHTTHNYILMPLYDETGAKNYIDISNPATLGATVKALTTTATDPLKRLYPLPFAENVTREKTERITETPPSGNVYNVQDGLRQNSMDFYGANASFSFARELQKFGCTMMGYFSVDINGTLEGYIDESDPTKFYPLPMMQNTFYQMYQYATDTTIQKLTLQFNLQRNFDETQIYYITSHDLGYPATELRGLLPAYIAVSGITSTGAVFTITQSVNTAIETQPIEGLVLADFDLTNMSTGTPVVSTTLTEGLPGVYTATYTAVVGTHTFKVGATATGYDIADQTYLDPA